MGQKGDNSVLVCVDAAKGVFLVRGVIVWNEVVLTKLDGEA
jgi:hypothetical protein